MSKKLVKYVVIKTLRKMKQLFCAIAIFTTMCVNAQTMVKKTITHKVTTDTTNGRWYTSKDFKPASKNIDDSKPMSYVTHRKDTLFLVNEDIGLATAKLWEGSNYKPERDGKKPKIVLVSQKYIIARHENKAIPRLLVND